MSNQRRIKQLEAKREKLELRLLALDVEFADVNGDLFDARYDCLGDDDHASHKKIVKLERRYRKIEMNIFVVNSELIDVKMDLYELTME